MQDVVEANVELQIWSWKIILGISKSSNHKQEQLSTLHPTNQNHAKSMLVIWTCQNPSSLQSLILYKILLFKEQP